jgi:rubredoxin
MMMKAHSASDGSTVACKRVGSVWLSAEAEKILLDEIRAEHAYAREAAQQITQAVEKAAGVKRTKVRPGAAPWTILREVITCPVCLAYRDGFSGASRDGFCPQCGTHHSLVCKQKGRAKMVLSGSRPWGGAFA